METLMIPSDLEHSSNIDNRSLERKAVENFPASSNIIENIVYGFLFILNRRREIDEKYGPIPLLIRRQRMGQNFVLVFGSDPLCDIVINRCNVSAEHAAIAIDADNKFQLVNLISKVDGEHVLSNSLVPLQLNFHTIDFGSSPLYHNDVITIEPRSFLFKQKLEPHPRFSARAVAIFTHQQELLRQRLLQARKSESSSPQRYLPTLLLCGESLSASGADNFH